LEETQKSGKCIQYSIKYGKNRGGIYGILPWLSARDPKR